MDIDFKITKILYNMKHMGDLYHKLSSKAAEECNLTKPEADILIFIKNNPKHNTATDMVKLRGFSKAYVSKAIEPLLDKELIKIEVDKEDRRCQHLSLTEKADPLLDILLNMQSDFIDIITEGIAKQDIKTYMDVMDQISYNSKKR